MLSSVQAWECVLSDRHIEFVAAVAAEQHPCTLAFLDSARTTLRAPEEFLVSVMFFDL
jgi:hypothetical protein